MVGSIAEDVAREEQASITRELKQANRTLATATLVFAKIADTPDRALELVGQCDEVYRLVGRKFGDCRTSSSLSDCSSMWRKTRASWSPARCCGSRGPPS